MSLKKRIDELKEASNDFVQAKENCPWSVVNLLLSLTRLVLAMAERMEGQAEGRRRPEETRGDQ